MSIHSLQRNVNEIQNNLQSLPLLAKTVSGHMLPIQSPSETSHISTDGVVSPLSPEQSASKVYDLPVHLLSAGWRRFWSTKGEREYFYNKFTKESRWEYPEESCDHFSDPLRISEIHQQPQTARSLSGDGSTGLAGCHPSLKRTNSEKIGHQSNVLGPPVKRINLIPSPFWDFGIPSNVLLGHLTPMNHILMHPHPEVEQLRGTLVAKLRQNYQDLCSHREGIDAPPESFNRWLLERRVVDKGCDALLPSDCPQPLSQAMFREVMNDIPVRLVRPRRNDDARKMLAKYAEAARSLVEKRGGTSAESRKSVTWHAEETFAFLQKRSGATFDDYMERLAHLKRECQPHVIAAAKSSVESICTKVYSLSCEYAKKIREKHVSILQQAGADVKSLLEPIPSSTEDLSKPVALYSPGVPCSPVTLSCPIIPSPIVDHQEVNEIVSLRANICNPEVLKINLSHFKKLEQLYQLNCRDDPGMVHFLNRVWCLLKRYNTFFGTKENEGFGLQGALPAPVFQCLNRVFGVTFECFASPLNCFFKQYCSAFADTDGYFGSRGPVLDFYPRSGSFEANPPFNEELMEAMVDHFESLLSETNEPLSFIVFIPDWKDPPTEALMRLESSRYKRNQTSIPAMEHEYRHGFQHICQKKDLNVKSVHGTLVVFLQNEEGAKKWPVTSKEIKDLIHAYHKTTTSN